MTQDQSNTTANCSGMHQYGLLRVSGPDAGDFLAAQFSSDIRSLDTDHFQHSSWCDAKGRALCSLQIFIWQDAYYLLLSGDLGLAMEKRLRMFVLRSRVEIQNVSEQIHMSAWSGNEIMETLLDCEIKLPQSSGQVAASNDHVILNMGTPVPLFYYIGNTPLQTPLEVQPDEEQLKAILISGGLATVTAASSGEHIPQMLNYDLIGAISFNKGCYPGQEIITRLKHRGGLKQRCYLFSSDPLPELAVGHRVIDAEGALLGHVVNFASLEQQQIILLAVINIGAADSPCFLEGQGSALRRRELPYAVPAA